MESLVPKCLCAWAVLASLAAVAAKPAEFTPGAMDLSAVLNRTTCPIVVAFDEDQHRIPKRIKILKCGNDPLEHCKSHNVPDYECCHNSRDDLSMSCVEVQDLVQVFYPGADGGRHQTYAIPVGCTCVVEPVTLVGEASPS